MSIISGSIYRHWGWVLESGIQIVRTQSLAMSNWSSWEMGKLRRGKVTWLQSKSQLATERHNRPLCLSPLCFFSALCCYTFPKREAKNGTAALGKGPELVTQCGFNSNLILKQKTFQNVPRAALYFLTQPGLRNHCPRLTAREKVRGAVSSENAHSVREGDEEQREKELILGIFWK